MADPSAPTDGSGIDDFLTQFKAIERAWALLDAAQRQNNADIAAAVALGAQSSAVLVRAAEMLTAHGLDRGATDAIERALALDGPTAPAQIAYARQMRVAGDLHAARTWYRRGLLRARPELALILEYAGLEQDLGEPQAATRIAAAARGLASGSAANLIEVGRRLGGAGRSDLAGIAFAEAFGRGDRGDDLLSLIVTTEDGPAGCLAEPLDPAIAGGPTIRSAAASTLAHVRLSATADCAAAVAGAQAREASPAWMTFDQLPALLGERIARREPFSWIRLGDGEARFLLHARPDLRGALDDDEVGSIVDLIWSIWFGRPFAEADPARIATLGRAFEDAIANADLLGVSSAERLTGDQAHRGYCAVLEHYLQTLPPNPKRLFTDAGFNTRLHESDPFLGELLHGLDFLGVIGPHPALAARLGRQLGIARTTSYDIPGEGRLGRPREQADRGRHFPEVYDRLMADLSVPFPGAVFLVAGGLLGKMYCDRIRALGGIALDIGALADAWVGINTRGRPLDLSMGQVLPA